MAAIQNPAIPIGSVVLVTGASGFLGSNIADQLLTYGYHVRGTTRDVSKAAWLTALFDNKYGGGKFELVSVPDMEAEGAYDDVVKGVAAVVHSASVMALSPDPKGVIPAAVAGAVNALKATYGQPGVKRFVFTSSSAAAVMSIPGRPGLTVTKSTWNEEAIREAWAPAPYEPSRQGWNYAASKAEAEKAVWKYHHENRLKRPDLVVNTVLPNMCYGKPLDLQAQGYASSSAGPVALWKGEDHILHSLIQPQYCIDVSDTGRLHVAAVVLPDVEEDRIFGFASPFSWDAMLDVMRKREPSRKLRDNFSGGKDSNVIKPAQEAEELLKRLGRPGWIPFDEIVQRNIEDVA